MNHVHEGVFLVDEDARILYTNDEAARALGYSREELLRMRVPDIDPDYPPEQWVRFCAIFRRQLGDVRNPA